METAYRLRRRLQTQAAGILTANALGLVTLAILPVALHFDLYTGGWLGSLHVQPKLHEYCQTHRCSLDPALVSTSYAFQGIYALTLTLIGSILCLHFREFGDRKVRIKGSVSMLIITAVFLFDDATGFERGIYSNYVYSNPAYIFHPTFAFLIVTSLAIVVCWYAWNYAALMELRRQIS